MKLLSLTRAYHESPGSFEWQLRILQIADQFKCLSLTLCFSSQLCIIQHSLLLEYTLPRNFAFSQAYFLSLNLNAPFSSFKVAPPTCFTPVLDLCQISPFFFSLEIFSIIVSSNLIFITFIWYAVMFYQHIYFCCFFCTTYHILLQSPSSLQHTGFIGQSCQTLRDPMDYSPLASSVHAILQARILEWFVIYSSNLNSPAMSIMSINHPSKSNISHDPALNAKQSRLACLH